MALVDCSTGTCHPIANQTLSGRCLVHDGGCEMADIADVQYPFGAQRVGAEFGLVCWRECATLADRARDPSCSESVGECAGHLALFLGGAAVSGGGVGMLFMVTSRYLLKCILPYMNTY